MSYRTYDGLDFIFGGRTHKKEKESRVEASGIVDVVSKRGYKATVRWALFKEGVMDRDNPQGGGSSDSDENLRLGLFGELFRDEVYNLCYEKHGRSPVTTMLERYGIIRFDVRKRVAILVEPESPSERFIGATPSPSRDLLNLANNPLPHAEWGENFAEHMPRELAELIFHLDNEPSKSLAERLAKAQKRLQGVFTRKRRHPGGDDKELGQLTDEKGDSGVADTGTKGLVSREHERGRRGGGTASPKKRVNIGGGVKKQLGTSERHHTSGAKPIHPVWDDSGSEFRDEEADGLLVKWERATRTLFVNGAHPYLKDLVEAEMLSRPKSRRDDVKSLAQEAVLGHLAGQVLAVEMYRLSAMAGKRGRQSSFEDKAKSDEALSAALLNIETIELVVRNSFRGRTGFAMMSEAA